MLLLKNLSKTLQSKKPVKRPKGTMIMMKVSKIERSERRSTEIASNEIRNLMSQFTS